MSMNPSWPKWICASVIKHFTDIFDANGIKWFVEGGPRATDGLTEWVEIRLNGPFWSAGSAGEWVCDPIQVNIFIQSTITTEDIYRPYTLIGLVCAGFTSTIPVLKLGQDVGDDDSDLLCLTLRTQGKEQVKVVQLGQVAATTQLLRAAVEGDYFGNFNEP